MHLRAPHDCRNTTTTTTSAVTSRSRSRSDPHSHKTQQKNKSPPSLHRVYASLCQTSRPHSRQTAALTLTLTHTHFFSTCLRCCYASFPPPFFTSALPTIYFMFSHGTHTLTLYLCITHTHTLSLPLFVCVCLPLFTNPPNSFRFWSLSFCGLPEAFVYLSPVSKGWVCYRSIPNSSPSLLSQFPKSHCYIVKHWLDA